MYATLLLTPLLKSGFYLYFVSQQALTRLPIGCRPVRGSAIRRAGARHEERLTALMVRPMRGEVRLRHAPQ